jgi:DNA-binding SARP family transcriptional activator/Tfp pilus assembly protein PilF
MEFGLLGPLVVRSGETVMPVPSGKQRALLALLLLSAGRVVPVDDIAEALWGAAPPPSAPVTVRNYVRRLRQALGAEGRERIIFRQGGYLISVGADELDVTRFGNLLASARAAERTGSWDQAARLARQALSLWRGEPLADVECDALALREGPRLAELRLQAVETRVAADLQLGCHNEVLAELQLLAAEHPLREHLHALLMLALYRSGRQAEALTAYQQARTVLVNELGVEPGSELRAAHQHILAAEPVDLPQPPDTANGPGNRPAIEASTSQAADAYRDGESSNTAGGRTPDVPRQLPASVAQFTGRADELSALTQILDQAGTERPGTVLISAISGMAGVGKTALALHWAHQIASRFSDGQLYVNLRGFDPSGTPLSPAEAIRGFLDALGVPPGKISPAAEAQASLYRSLLANKRMLILLDNAHDEQQVRPLLPASPGSLVLVTSRNQLSGLAAADAARLISLDVLTHAEAVQLLTVRLGHGRAAAEPEALSEIASMCARLPLALAVAAARAAAQPRFPLEALAAGLRDVADRLDVLDAADPAASVRAVFSWSIRQLSDPAARMFRLLGIHPGPDISGCAGASLAGIADAEARRLLRELARAHLISEHVPGRYAVHDLLRAYAAAQAQNVDSQTDRDTAIGRVLDHYLHTAACATRLLIPAKEPVALASISPGATARQLVDHWQALVWFEEEHQVLLSAITLAADSRLYTHAWQIPWAMEPFLQTRGHWQELAATQRVALTAATQLEDSAGQAMSGRLLGIAYASLGDHDRALGHYVSSLTLYQQLGNRLGEAKIQQNLGTLAEYRGRYGEALRHSEQALRLFRVIGDKANEAAALNNVGWYHGNLGDFQQARAFCRQALTLCTDAGYLWIEPYVLDSLGYAEQHLGSFAEAVGHYQRALSLYRESGDRFYEATTLTRLGDTQHAAGELAKAQEAWQQAFAILHDLQHPAADEVRAKLASTSKTSDGEGGRGSAPVQWAAASRCRPD